MGRLPTPKRNGGDKVFRLDIVQTMARLDMQGQNAQLDTSMRPSSLEITSQPGQMEIESSHPQISIDATTAKSEEGHATTAELVERFASAGEQDAQEAARQYNAWGRAYRAQMRNKNAIAQYARNQAVPAMPTYALRFVPSVMPSISFSDNTFSYHYQPKTLHLDWNTYQNALITEDHPAALSIWVAQQPEVHFSLLT